MSEWAEDRNAVVKLAHSVYGQCRVIDSSFLIDTGGSPVEKPQLPPPMLGEHSVELMREAGIAESEIDALCAQGAVLVLPH